MSATEYISVKYSQYSVSQIAYHIVLTSGYLMNVDSVDHDGFFSKPYDVKKIINHIKTLFD